MSDQLLQTERRTITRKTRQINVVLRNAEAVVKPAEAPEPPLQGRHIDADGPFKELFRELDQMIGLDHVKELVYEIYALLQIKKYREQAGLHTGSHVYHMVFRGNPGTGKTTVARIVAKLFQSMGMLSKGHLIEAERADLVGEYIGHTALKTRELVKKAMGGILFIDEAYSLARGGEKDFGKECIDALVKAMEDHKNDFILILAGYTDEMEQFLMTNPGLPSRFPIQIDFPDYTVDQLIRIAEQMLKERQYHMLPQALMKMKEHLMQEKQAFGQVFSNARYVRNQIERAMRFQAVRLMKAHPAVPTKQELMSILPEDLRFD
ncbi:AAA family ATPase [Xylanibacillus composti]|uniref:Stage V sporulation protein K n=1 Tax=Xylanibacillus composti TaxID=1572762 RepID=A0A8J4H438_9BACL|nr:AAA family ATPase [Xylanibacillus composti]MDT9724284.1 AAA family ATPase [Xylanibacillus composti]GIQ69280.1 stage V sporulation protein K [Xylanibacillus composti]